MKPHIDGTKFGAITVGGKVYDHDILIGLDGEVRKRRKSLSKEIFGTSHTLSEQEAEYVFAEGAETLVIGTGQFGRVSLSDDARTFFERRGVRVILEATPTALETWNEMEGRVIALFHTTC